MSFVSMILTNAGANLVAQANAGGPAVTLTNVAIGDTQWSPDATATALNNEVTRIAAIDGGVSGNVVYLTLSDDSSDVYEVREVGLYTSTGVLFAIWSGAAIASKTAGTALFLALDVAVSSMPLEPGSITVAATNFGLPPATETLAGISRLATTAEAQNRNGAGVITASKLATALDPYLNLVISNEQAINSLGDDLESVLPYVASDEKAGTVDLSAGHVVLKADFPAWDERVSGHRFYIGHLSGLANCSGGASRTFEAIPKRYDDVGNSTVDFGRRMYFLRENHSNAALIPFDWTWVMGASSVDDVQINCRLENFSAGINNLLDVYWQVIGLPTKL